jgi:phage terminase large subunit-like protein
MAFLATLPPEVQSLLNEGWLLDARDHQIPPDEADSWHSWLLLGGRGAGKTRAGAEWVTGMVRGLLGIAQRRIMRIALIAETLADVRDVMVHGPSGLIAVSPRGERPRWKPSLRRLEWPSGAVAHAFSAEDPDSLRGPQFEAAWADELGKWRYAEETWDMLQFGLRLGVRPRQVVTTTPRAIPLIRRLIDDPSVATTRARTADNAANLAPSFLAQVTAAYGGTRLGRQELDGELIEDRPDALWQRETIEAGRVKAAPPLARIVVAVDPPASSGRRAGACGIVAAGVDSGGAGYVVADETVAGAAPEAWAAQAVALYRRLQADALVAEVNQGGEMVAAVLRVVDPAVPVTTVVATRGKHARAEPVSALYRQGRVHHVGSHPALEDEMCDFTPAGLSSGRSPDRLDALVWALSHLMLTAAPRMRAL